MAKYWVANNPNSEVTNAEAVRISNSQREVVRQSDDDDTAITLTVSQSGALVLFDEDEAYAITLPAITSSDIGVTYEFMETVASDLLRKITTATIITLGDDNLANAGGGLGARVVLTAVLTGNVAASGGAKLVWAVSGNKVAQAITDTGAAFFA